MNLETYIERYLALMNIKEFADSTQKTYLSVIKLFLAQHNNYAQPKDISADVIIKWLSNISGVSYRIQCIGCLKTFYEYIIHQPEKLKNIPYPKRDQKLPVVLAKEQIQKLISLTKNNKHKLMLALQYSCGLRVSELTNIKFTHISRQRMQLIIKQSKGRKDRIVTIQPDIIKMMDTYYKTSIPQPKVYLFEGQKGDRYTTRSIQEVFHQAKQRAGISIPCSTHSLRHSFATHMLEMGVDLRFIQEILGHANSKTTERYTQVSTASMAMLPNPFSGMVYY